MYRTDNLKQFASRCQMAADEMAWTLIKERSDMQMYAAFQDSCSFNVFNTLKILGWYRDSIMFVIANAKELKRKFELHEFIEFATKFRIISIRINVKSFEHFKSIKIKKATR